MYNSRPNGSVAGVSFTGVLQIIFLVLKLTGLINWSWLWVLSPMWISAGFFVLVMLVAIVAILVNDAKER